MSNYRLIFLTCLLSIGVVFPGKLAFAQNSGDNPLLKPVDKGDLLIPPGYGRRELTSFEQYRIEETIPELDRAAEAELEQGNDNEAMKLWYRRLMLTRALDPILEIEALGEIGAIAWKENRGTDVRNIAERLIAIEEESVGKISLDALDKLATAYQQVRYLVQQLTMNNGQWTHDAKHRSRLTTRGGTPLPLFEGRKLRFRCATALHLFLKKED